VRKRTPHRTSILPLSFLETFLSSFFSYERLGRDERLGGEKTLPFFLFCSSRPFVVIEEGNNPAEAAPSFFSLVSLSFPFFPPSLLLDPRGYLPEVRSSDDAYGAPASIFLSSFPFLRRRFFSFFFFFPLLFLLSFVAVSIQVLVSSGRQRRRRTRRPFPLFFSA